jgi:polar amino acid transport system substrate-binding protein
MTHRLHPCQKTLRLALLNLGAAALLAPLTAAAAEPILTVGIEATYPPMSYRDPQTNQSVGFNIDLLKAMAKQMQVELKFQEMSFEQLTSGLATGRIDVIGTAITDLPSRRANMTFVDYLKTGAQMFTTVKHQAIGRQPAAFCGHSIGTPRTTNYFAELNAWSEKHCVGTGLPAATVQGAAGAAAVRLDLQQGRLNAAVLGPEYVKYLMIQEANTYVLVGEPLSEHAFGFAVAKTNLQTRDALVKALNAVIADGTYRQTLDQWGLHSQAVSAAAVDGGQ